MIHGLPTQTEYLTYDELAERLRVSTKTIARMKRDGLPYVTFGRRLIRFNAVEAIRWASERERAA